ncbi:unnamed protein product [Polarella glacialis]|uniref:Uncharacterized protein n=1 Tax=Polarella glacialis TaxID=89957 RepID=A0A813J8W7_POLGL|nr:unnamed protein product [Polarella glacialis]
MNRSGPSCECSLDQIRSVLSSISLWHFNQSPELFQAHVIEDQVQQPLRDTSIGSAGSTTATSSMAAVAAALVASCGSRRPDPYEGLRFTRISDRPFQEMSSISKNAQKSLVDRLISR